MSLDRDLDLIVFGATGFTGRQAAAYVAAHAPPELRWALAARSADKLAAVRASLGTDHADRELIVVDGLDAPAVDAMAARTRVLLTTVGPYADHGSLVLAACARHGTDYCDITGETPWVREMIDQHHDTAGDTGARILPFCGFDSVPSDLGSWMMADWIRREWDQDTREVRTVFKMKGGFNGGTAATFIGTLERGEAKLLADPFLLNPRSARPERGSPLDQRSQDLRGALHQEWVGGWVAPFLMAPINSRVVRRSQALLTARGQGYGPDFAYQESMWAGRGLKGRLTAHQVTLAMGMTVAVGSTRPGLALIRKLVPAPGEGPSEEAMDGGFMQGQLWAQAADGSTVRGLVQADGDPGNRNTVRMLCEAALCLCLQGDEVVQEGGVLTPASALGRPYLERLRATGMRWEVGA